MPGASIFERLQVKHGRRLALLGASAAMAVALATDTPQADAAEAEVLLAFAADRASLHRQLKTLRAQASAGKILWLAYPKLASRLAGELSREVVREAAAGAGLDTVSQIAVDEDWSAMRLKPLA